MPRKTQKTTDAIAIIHRRHYANRPDREIALQEERANAEIARKIYDLRKAAGLSQRALAELVGTTASVICRLEDADYEGHSLAMLQLSHAKQPCAPPNRLLKKAHLLRWHARALAAAYQ